MPHTTHTHPCMSHTHACYTHVCMPHTHATYSSCHTHTHTPMHVTHVCMSHPCMVHIHARFTYMHNPCITCMHGSHACTVRMHVCMHAFRTHACMHSLFAAGLVGMDWECPPVTSFHNPVLCLWLSLCKRRVMREASHFQASSCQQTGLGCF
jgi:hypothetical protein